jgi:hypothetical protein
LGKPTGSPGKLERGAFPQYWLFPANPRCRAVNRKDREFVVGLFGSPNMAEFELLSHEREQPERAAPRENRCWQVVTDGENDERRVDRAKTMLIRECCLNFQSALGSD